VLGEDNMQVSVSMERVAIYNNLFTEIGTAPWCGAACNGFKRFGVWQSVSGGLDPLDSLVTKSNTSFNPGGILVLILNGFTNFVYLYNITELGANGVLLDGDGSGTTALNTVLRDLSIRQLLPRDDGRYRVRELRGWRLSLGYR
jgi:hypothetical protein